MGTVRTSRLPSGSSGSGNEFFRQAKKEDEDFKLSVLGKPGGGCTAMANNYQEPLLSPYE
jgi:hypothetical protein